MTGCSVCGDKGYVRVQSAPYDYNEPCRVCNGVRGGGDGRDHGNYLIATEEAMTAAPTKPEEQV